MLWTIWLVLMIATPTVAGVVVWLQLRSLPATLPTEPSEAALPETLVPVDSGAR